MRNNSQGKKQEVEDQRRNVKLTKNKMSVTTCNDSLNAKTLNVKSVSAMCDKCVLIDKHAMCVLNSVVKPIKKTITSESNKKPRHITRKLYERVSKTCSWWYLKFTPSGYKWKPKSGEEYVNPNLVEIVLFIVDPGCSKHMTGNLKLLINFVEKFLGTIKFGNDQIAPILGYGDLVVQLEAIPQTSEALTPNPCMVPSRVARHRDKLMYKYRCDQLSCELVELKAIDSQRQGSNENASFGTNVVNEPQPLWVRAEVYIKNIFNAAEIVAKGRLKSLDPNEIVRALELMLFKTSRKYAKGLLLLVEDLMLLVVAAAKLPILNPNEFDLWKMRIKQCFLMIDYSLWKVILNGDSPTPTKVVDGVVQPIAPTTAEQRLAKNNELKARGTLLMALPNKHHTNESVSAVTSVSAASTKPPAFILSNVDNLVMLSFTPSLQEIDLKWQMAMLTMRARRGYFARECRSPKDTRNKDTHRRSVPVELLLLMHCSETDVSVPTSPVHDSETVPTIINVKPSLTKPTKDMSQSNRPSAPFIKDWVSDTEDESEGEPMPTQNAPSFVQTSEHVKSPRPYVKPVKHPTQAKNLRKDIPKSRVHRNSWNRKACFVCKSVNHLMKGSDYYEKKMVQKHVWNHAMRINHQNSTRMTHPHSKKHVVLTTVLTKSRLVPLNVARPITTAVNPQQALKDKEIDRGYVTFDGNPKGGKIIGKGKIKTGKLDSDDVYFVKELKFNLFSVSQMCDKKNSVLFTDTECVVLSFDFKLPDENHVLLRVPRENNMYNVDLENIIPSRDLTCLFAKATLDESNLWHRRLGHINFKTINKLVKGNLVRGLPSKVFENNHTCVACKKGKKHRGSCKTKPVSSVSQPLQRTPYELSLGRTPSIGFVRPFGCPVTILNTLDPLGKFNRKADERFLVGYSVSSKAFRVFNTRTRIIQETLHINFLESQPNVAGNGPTWLFDIDTLTLSMNYQLVVAENQPNHNAGVQGNFDADVDVAFDDKENESEVHVSPSSSNKPKKRDEKAKREAKGKSPIDLSIGVRDLSDEFKEFFVNSTNRVNATTHQTRSMARMVKEQGGLTQINDEDFHTCMFACFLSQEEPKRVHEAFTDPSWIEAMQEDLLQFKMQKEEGIDYEEVFAPIARIEAIRLFLAYASFMGFMVYQMDVKGAFLYETIEEEVYVCQPLGFKDPDHLDKVYVDDIIYGSTNKELRKAFEKSMKDNQDKYVAEILKKFSFTDSKSASTPTDTEKPLLKDLDSKDVDVHIYRSMIGSLLYLTSSRPDIMFSVCARARFQVTPKVSHLHVVKRIFRYLKGKPHLGLWYPKDSPFNLVAYSDSDYAGASLDRKSTTGSCQFLGCRLISWQCKKQTVVATLSTEAE
nr:hypothetical protein [Tanacetum cinerariifolium]